ncbi:hypothetical protein HDU87_004197 [Geranomyces variabilis]|uniref:feruloyl esterase n=1 Tax=Geranomyces variabilis TaxID=109894 RepID=A0AAD5XQX4_9FUNG|nr:hypothetical protein HDU87_004197 [Geranomyces variabilis]
MVAGAAIRGPAAIGAPAFRYGFQQVNHLFQNLVEKDAGYFPPPCEFAAIVNAAIEFCRGGGGGGGRPGGPGGPGGPPPAPTPAQKGTVSAQALKVATTILGGLKDSSGKQVYIQYQFAAQFVDGATPFHSTTQTWKLSISSLAGEWITRFLQHYNSTLASLDGVTLDTLKQWMILGTKM